MLVEGDISNHKCNWSVRVACVHCLTDSGLDIAVPDDVASVTLCLERVREELNNHVKENCVKRGCLCEVLCVSLVTLVDDSLESDTGLLHVRDRDCPVVECRSECYVAL